MTWNAFARISRTRHAGRVVAAVVVLGATLLATSGARAQEPGPRGNGGRFAGMERVQGEVTAVDGATLTIKGEDGTTYHVVTTDNTRVMHGAMRGGIEGPGGRGARQAREEAPPQPTPIKVAEIKAGDGLMAAGQMDAPNKTLHAAMIVDTDAATVKAMRENWGKTYISGRVTAVDLDNAKLTVERPDHTALTIGLDESTSFRRAGRGRGAAGSGAGQGIGAGAGAGAGTASAESITLADVKVGDTVVGQGAVKSGLFVPSQLVVMAPRAPRSPGGQAPAGQPAPPPSL